MQSRAYATLQIKSVNEEERVIEGIASTPAPDRMGDIVEPLGAKFELPMPLLWQHNHDEPIGHVEFAEATEDGIPFRARLARVNEAGTLRDRIDEAWQSIKAKLVRAVSIGFRALEYSFLDDGGIRFQKWEWLELSVVTIPANTEATIQQIKSIDTRLREEAGIIDEKLPEATPPAATGEKKVRVVKLDDPARDRAPFVVRQIKRT